MPVRLEIDPDIIVLGFFVKVLYPSCSENRVHPKGNLQVLGRRIVGIVSLHETNCRIHRSKQSKKLRIVNFFSSLPQLSCKPIEEFSQNSTSTISVD
jgi:hypothetical protein